MARPLTPEGTSGTWPTPDGKQILTESGDGSLLLFPVAGGAPVPLNFRLDAETQPLRFAADGSSFYVQRSLPNGDVLVARVAIRGGAEQAMFTVSLHGQPGAGGLRVAGISADGKTYIYRFHSQLSTLYAVTGLR